MAIEPYSSSPIFDEIILPDALRNNHSTKAGAWSLLRVLEGEMRLVFDDLPREVKVGPANPAPIPPEAIHDVEVVGPMRMQVEFFCEPPLGTAG